MKHAIRILSLCLIALFCFSLLPANANAQVSALFVNVRKADAALFWLNDRIYLIDTGHKDSLDQLQRVLDAYGVAHLDGIIVTHTDKDHVGGLKKLLKGGLTADRLYAGSLHSEKSLEDHPVYEASEKYGVPVTWLSAGDQIDAGDGCVFHVLGPIRQDNENENNNSLVLRLVTPEGDMLLTGDMELEEEADLLEAGLISRAEVLKVAHHGEDDSTSKVFALTVRPQWAVISTNTQDEPDTPDQKIISRLEMTRCVIAETQSAEVGILITLEDGKASAHEINWQ